MVGWEEGERGQPLFLGVLLFRTFVQLLNYYVCCCFFYCYILTGVFIVGQYF